MSISPLASCARAMARDGGGSGGRLGRKGLALLGAGGLVLALDRAGKHFVVASLEPGERAAFVGNLLSLVHGRVSGAAFGLMDDWGSATQIGALGLLSLACAVLVLGFYRGLASGEVGSAAALGAVLAGVIGNLLDRLQYGAGIDFLHLGPTTAGQLIDFDVADLAIVVGLVTLLFELLAVEMAARVEESRRS